MNRLISFSLMLGIIILLASGFVYLNDEPETFEKNYLGLYLLGLIPNSPELPPTKSDKILARDYTHEMVESPFGLTYIREIKMGDNE